MQAGNARTSPWPAPRPFLTKKPGELGHPYRNSHREASSAWYSGRHGGRGNRRGLGRELHRHTQLGLTVDATIGPVEVLVIDSVEHPASN